MPKATFLQLEPEKQRRVRQAALAEFADHPFDRANLDRIAAAAGVPKGSLYQYFENKRDCFDMAAQHAFSTAFEQFAIHLRRGRPRDCFEEFRQALLFAVTLAERESLIARLYFRVGFLEQAELQDEIVSRNSLFQKQWFDRGIAEGLLDRRIDRKSAGFFLDAVANRFHFFALSEALDKRALRRLASALTGLVRRALTSTSE